MIPSHLLGSPKRVRPFLLALSLLVLGAGWWAAHAEAKDETPPQAVVWSGRWSDEVLDLVALIPVQSQGRVKPLHTWAGYSLLNSNHRRSCRDSDGNKLTALEWWLDAVFRPEHAKGHRCFLVSTSEVLEAVGLPDVAKKKRDRYSYNDLVASAETRGRITSMARQFHEMDAKERSRVEDGIVNLENSLQMFEGLLHLVDFARAELDVGRDPALKARFDGRDRARVMEILAKSPELAALVLAEREATSAQDGHRPGAVGSLSQETQAVSDVLEASLLTTRRGLLLGMFAPAATIEKAPEWFSVRDVLGYGTMQGVLAPEHLRALQALEGMTDSVGQEAAFVGHLESYLERVRSLAETRAEYEKIEQEVAYYELDPFGKSQVFYLIAFALLALTWLPIRLRWMEIVVWAMLWGTLALHTYGIVLRCLIRDRPPITGLYDTVIFISACGVLCTLVIERMSRRKVALALTPIIGAVGLFIAARYEVLNGTDTMPQLVAVLDTNFWLATHVTCISIGYCAGLVAGLIAHVYVLGKAFRFKRGDQAFYRDVGKMVYGTLCFALVFSLVGTILGGIWANDSWGRFWGWDPKENGALLICISQLAILHGRRGGIFGTFGVCQGAIFGAMIVAFSWWGVNLLGIGLHSYGFATGISRGLNIFYSIEGAVLLIGFLGWLRDRPKRAARSMQA